MALNSDYNRMKNLLETEELTHIEFSEHWGSENSGHNIAKKVQYGGFTDNSSDSIDYLFDSDEKKHKKPKKQNGGFRTEEVNIDYLFTSEQNLSGGADYGNHNKNIENDFLAIFNTAKEYSKRIENIAGAGKNKSKVDVVISDSVSNNMTGGSYYLNDDFSDQYNDMTDNYSQFGAGVMKSPKIAGMLEIAKKIKNHAEITKAGIVWKHLLSVAGLIWDDAAKQTAGSDPEAIKKKALELSNNPSKYIQQFKLLPPKPVKIKKPKKVKAPTTPSRVHGGFY